MKRHNGFTLIEIIVASSILSLFMVGVFQLYRSGSQSFLLGSWKTRAQKESQLFLEELRTILEVSGNALVFRDNVIDPPLQLPVHLHSGANNLAMPVAGLNGVIGFANMLTPCTLYSSLAPAQVAGTWVGVVLSANNGSLQLRTYIDPSLMPPQAMPWALPLGGDFVAAPESSLRPPRTLRDVELFEVQQVTVDGKIQLLLRITMRRSGHETRVVQEVRANLLRGVSVEWF
ncbi:MAG: hypothetical protein CVV42_11345 [Candidatus Riflebacteria bacterium HGW-Riflebacteria-2]|jgi:prepilin-type N-terminal cleavage/methylation domain-containing protein|nr:MAG: hypothetical protein CVV42_11345 [Candidatus Riflebacteria bacterium HGW-Riflebacteria-2]